MSDKNSDIRIFALNSYIKPDIKETQNKDWVLNGKNNSFYQYTIDRYNGSATNAAVINSYIDLIYGKGLINTNGNLQGWLQFQKMIRPEEIRQIISDFELFGEALIQVIPAKNSDKTPTLYHLAKEKTAPQKKNDDNEIEGYYYSDDWSKAQPDNTDFYPILSKDGSSKQYCYPIRPYKAGKVYFSDPDYLAGLQYAELEEEISNYYLSHIINGLSFGYIINIPNGNGYTPEEKEEIETKIKRNLTGSSNAGRFIINFNGGEAEITVTAIQNNDAHKQWEYLTNEARQQLLTAHRVTSPMLFGIKDNSGLGNNANELDVAEAQLMKRVVYPKQKYITDAFEDIAALYNIQLELKFKPITEGSAISTDKSFTGIQISSAIDVIDRANNGLLNKDQASSILRSMLSFPEEELKALFNQTKPLALSECVHGGSINPSSILEYFAQDAPEGYVIDRVEDVGDESESDDLEAKLNKIQLADIEPKGTSKSKEDSPLYKVRYRYKKDVSGGGSSRDFCTKMHALSGNNKFFRKEDIGFMSAKGVNKDFGHKGQNYSIWLYKGGVNCHDVWERVIFKKELQDDGKPMIGNPLQNVDKVNKAPGLDPMPKKVTTAPINMPNNGHHPNY